MKGKNKDKRQLTNEITALRQRIAKLEALETEYELVQESLKESERKLSTLIRNLPGMAYRCLNDEHWTMEFISEGCIELTGRTPSEIIGNRILAYNDMIHPDDRDIIWNQIQDALGDREPFRVTYRIQTATGAEKWVWEQGVGIFSHEGNLLALEGFVTDITKRKEAEYALQKAYEELADVSKAKSKVISHLSHELKTPVSVLSLSLNSLERKLQTIPQEGWKNTIERARKNLERIMEIQYETEDIMQERKRETQNFLSLLLDQCSDELEALVVDEVGESSVIERLRTRIDELFGPKEILSEDILLHEYVKERLEVISPLHSQREVEITTHLEATPPIRMALNALRKVIDGLTKNAIENTPDEGKIEIIVRECGKEVELIVHDFGIGIPKEQQKRIFEGFFATQDTIAYSSKKPFDFNAGGRGADLLRMEIFSEQYNFKIEMHSSRCGFIPKEKDICPGRISSCSFCTKNSDCYKSGGTTFSVIFPAIRKSTSHGRSQLQKTKNRS